MLLKFLYFLHCFLYLCAGQIPSEERWTIKYLSNTHGGKYNRSINGYEFDRTLYETEIPNNFCRQHNIEQSVQRFDNKSGYVFCTGYNKGIQQFCPPGTEVTFKTGGCVNKTTNATVFPNGSRCASKPCENGGLCFDLSSADAYDCNCPYPYTGVHCQIQERGCPRRACGNRTSEISPACYPYTSDKALLYTCICVFTNKHRGELVYALNDCHSEKLFNQRCDGKEPVIGAFPFSNKAFYICPSNRVDMRVESCNLHHVWNDTQKECVLE